MHLNNIVVHDVASWDGRQPCVKVDDIKTAPFFHFKSEIPKKMNSSIAKASGYLLAFRHMGFDYYFTIIVLNPSQGWHILDTAMQDMDAATQSCVMPQELGNREIPRQHGKTHLLPLHPHQLVGCTDLETFFPLTPLIPKYTCVQLFVQSDSYFLFVNCMLHQSLYHNALQDAI